MKLSNYSKNNTLVHDQQFVTLGYVDSRVAETLCFADSDRYIQIAAENPNISAIITTKSDVQAVPSRLGLLIAESPRDTFYNIHQDFITKSLYPMPFTPGIGTNCQIHPSAIIGEGCRIGDNVKIGEYAVIKDNAWIDSNVTIESGVKIGVEGILYSSNEQSLSLIPHGGYTRIFEGAILMTNSIVVRSVHNTDVTEVGHGALIGLGSIVGHEAKVGDRAIISNHCVIARRARIGNKAFIGTNSMIKEHVTIGDKAKVMAGSIVITDVHQGKSVSGNFASNHIKRMLEFARNKGK